MDAQRMKTFNLGMAVLATIEPPEGGFSSRTIAAVCGISQQTVTNIERRAIEKMRAVAAHRKSQGQANQ